MARATRRTSKESAAKRGGEGGTAKRGGKEGMDRRGAEEGTGKRGGKQGTGKRGAEVTAASRAGEPLKRLPSSPVKIGLLSTGVRHFDEILGGGVPELSMTILAGRAGAGKTTLAQQIAFHVGTEERPAIYFGTLGEPVLKLLRYQQQYSFFDRSRVGSEVHFIDISSEVSEGGSEGALRAIGTYLERYNPRLVVIDSFRAVEDLCRGERMHTRRFVHDLAVQLAAWDCSTILVGEYPDEEVGVGPEFTVADNVLLLTQEVQHNSVVRRMRVVKVRGLAPQPGRHAFRITDDGVTLFPRALELPQVPRQAKGPRAGFGIPGLDQMMHGGIPRQQTCLVAGSSGTGKTLLGLHFAMAGVRAGEPCVMLTFEESPAEHAEKMAAFGWDLEKHEREGLIEMIYLRPIDLSIDEVIATVRAAVERRKARRVIVNSVSGLEIALPQTERSELREGLYRLTAELTSHGVVVLLTTEVPDLFGELQISTERISFIADNVILLRYVEIEAELRRALAVIKMRTSAHDATLHEYRIGKEGITIAATFKEYSGVLTGVPTLRALLEPRPFTAGLGEQEEALMHTLLALGQARAEDLAQAHGAPVETVQAVLDRLAETGYVVRTTRGGRASYRIALMAPARSAQGRRS